MMSVWWPKIQWNALPFYATVIRQKESYKGQKKYTWPIYTISLALWLQREMSPFDPHPSSHPKIQSNQHRKRLKKDSQAC